ncbi:MAG: LamG domain-containing protein [Pirellulales bacterium]|nr:LamG domain-containing protein [Pirellulales bacterium]
MDDFRDLDDDLARLLLATLSGDVTPDEVDRLNHAILSDSTLAGTIVEAIAQEAWLSWCAVPEGRRELTKGGDPHEVEHEGAVAHSSPHTATDDSRFRRPSTLRIALAAALLLAVGGVLGFATAHHSPSHLFNVSRRQSHSVLLPPVETHPTYVAHVVRASACRWESEFDSHLLVGSSLRRGELLNLVEGVAEVRFDGFRGVADLRIEGPAGILLSDNGSVSLSHGKVAAEVAAGSGQFKLETANGHIMLPMNASVGVSATDTTVSVHVFEGRAQFTAPWENVPFGSGVFELRRGEALTVRRDSAGALAVTRGVSQPESFISRSSMGADRLRIPDSYVQDVLALSPVLYWRFNGSGNGEIENLSRPGFLGHVEGKVRFGNDGGNQYIDFRSGVSQEEVDSFVISDQPLPIVGGDGYTVELWFKPSHFHAGAIAALVPESPEPDGPSRQGMVVELIGPWTNNQGSPNPGKVHFFHRWHPASATVSGTSCYSEKSYDLRRWQHLVVVKDRSLMRIFLDGRLAASVDDRTMPTTDLSLIIGQLDAGGNERTFVGQLDEVAVYLQPLSEAEVRRHYDLVRHPAAESASVL